jgi:tripartite-type tricarboxylate transporter receptor subunit TctC
VSLSKDYGNHRPPCGSFASARILLVTIGFLLACGGALAQPAASAYPSKSIHFILPFPPGGGTDILGRIIAERLTTNLGQPVVIENRGGAGGNVGAEAAAKSAPDGYTIVLAAPSLAISPSLYAKLNYDPVKDLAPVSLVGTVPNVLITHPSVPAQNLAEFIALAKSRPGGMNFGSGGNGTSNHLAGELFNVMAGVRLVHVPYKGVNLAMNDVLAGQIQLVVIGIPAALPFIKAGRLRALAVIAPQRSPTLPEVPTVAEAGLANYEVTTWYGVLAPAGTPRPIIERLNAEFVRVMHAPDLKERFAATGTEPRTSTPEEFADYIGQEIAKWGKVVREAGLKAD